MTCIKRTAQGKVKIAKGTSHPDLTMLLIPKIPMEEEEYFIDSISVDLE